ncbi:fructosamine kinase family protein [Saccharicrinis sp. GN24d3]|uniref:fructosamine kinase family protein n=1 Tax=Saccharicrinis sp. GN24d3 TaxID=3458416 RepID=UPI00403695BF
MNEALINRISGIVNEDIVGSLSQGGGCIANSQIIKTASGKAFFLKQGFSNGMFPCEANGLKELEKSASIKTPKVVAVDEDFLLLEYIEQGGKSREAMFNFGCSFAQMHQYTGSNFGFYEDNFIGATPQINSPNENWLDFYHEKRLLYQYKLAEKNGYANTSLKNKFKSIERQLPEILSGSEERPSLLHGDLWGGNYLIDSSGNAVLIDPAVYYGHREADLAMTKLFGGFSGEFYKGYQQTLPLKDGYAYRENIYLLYHVLNHLNLFGTGYYSHAIQLMDFYL